MHKLCSLSAAVFVAGLAAATGPALAGGVPMPANIASPSTNLVQVQFRLPIGMTAERLRNRLEQDGYDEIEVTYVGILDAKADACRKGKRYRVKLRIDGTYEYRNEIGLCRRQVTEDQLQALLRDKGYRRIDINEEPDGSRVAFSVTACRDRDRFELEVDEYGDIQRDRNIGPCRGELLSPREVRQALRKDGFDRIKFTDRTPRRYVVEACRENTRVRLDIDRRGRVRDRRRIGQCRTQVDPNAIQAVLEKEGYDRIEVGERRGRRYRVEACKGNDRMRMTISQWGQTLVERKIGECPPPATLAGLRYQFSNHPDPKLRDIRVRAYDSRQFPFAARICVDNDQYDQLFNRWGQPAKRERVSRNCRSPRLDSVVGDYRGAGLDHVQTFIIACDKGDRVQIEVGQYGEELDRRRIGRCRR